LTGSDPLHAIGLGKIEEKAECMLQHFVARLDGPLHFRFIAQPLMATIFAVIDGVRDAKMGKPPYFWAMIVSPGRRKELI
jgi:hypothetical protein